MRQQPPNREIGFVSSSFSFRVVRASGRGEAAWAREGRHPERWASREPGSSRRSGLIFYQLLLTGVRVLMVFGLKVLARGVDIVDRRAGFKVFGVCNDANPLCFVRVPRF